MTRGRRRVRPKKSPKNVQLELQELLTEQKLWIGVQTDEAKEARARIRARRKELTIIKEGHSK
jgi:hypothetical protein